MFLLLDDSPSWAITALVVGILAVVLVGMVIGTFLIFELIFPGSVGFREGSLRRLFRWHR